MPGIVIDDGYTLSDETKPADKDGNPLPTLKFQYRPAMPEAIYTFEFESAMAKSGSEQLDAAAKLLAAHLVSWDATTAAGTSAPLNANTVRLLPPPVLRQVITAVVTWLPKKGAAAAGNSPAA